MKSLSTFLFALLLGSSTLWVACTPVPTTEKPGQEQTTEPASDASSESTPENKSEPTDASEPSKEVEPEPTPEPDASVEPTPDTAPDGVTEPTPDSPDSVVETPPEPTKKWELPKCQKIAGIPSVLFSPDMGKTLVTSKEPFPNGIKYNYGLVALKEPGHLLAHYDNKLYRSTDSGCQWQVLQATTGGVLRLTLGAEDRVWAWSDNSNILYRIDGTVVTKLQSPFGNILGVGPHPTKKDFVRIGGRGQLQESQDGGSLWKKMGVQPAGTDATLWYRAAFAPGNWDAIVFGRARDGFWSSKDGGKTWKKAKGLTLKADGPANGFNAVFSPVDSSMVWAMAIDLDATSGKDRGKRLYLSRDGGETFTMIVANQQQKDVVLVNGPNLVPHPTNKDLLLWAFGTCASGYGTYLYTYNASTKKLTLQNQPYPSFNTIVVSPASPNALYLGLQTNRDPMCPKPKP